MAANDLADLRSRVRSLADMENNAFVDDTTDLLPFINEGWFALYDELVTLFEPFNRTSSDIVLVADQDTYDLSALDPLPYKLLAAELLVNDRYVPMQRFSWSERGSVPPGPNSFAGETVRLWYVPTPYPFADKLDVNGNVDNDAGTSPAGTIFDLPKYVQPQWAGFIVADAALRCATKEEGMAGNLPALTGLRADALARIQRAAPKRDAGAPAQAVRRADRMRGYDAWGAATRVRPYGNAPSIRYLFDSMNLMVLGGLWP